MKIKKPVLIITAIIIIVAVIVVIFFINKYNNSNNFNTPNNSDNSNNSIQEEEIKDSKTQYFTEKEDNSKENISKNLIKTKEFEGFRVSNIKLTEKDKEVILLADITNVSGKDTEKLTFFNITFFDNENKVIGTFPGVIDKVKNTETTSLNSSVTGDFANYINAYDFKIELDKSR